MRLRSIGDTVLATPTLRALRRFLPHAQIDVLLEGRVAPILTACTDVNRVLPIAGRSFSARGSALRRLRGARYDVAYDLHGGTTSTLFVALSGARHRVGYAHYRYGALHNHRAPHPSALWGLPQPHSVEQQLGLVGWTGVPVSDRPPTSLTLDRAADERMRSRLRSRFGARPFILLHPGAGWPSKRWAPESFGQVAHALDRQGLAIVAVAEPREAGVLSRVVRAACVPIAAWTDLSLPELTSLARHARLVVGNDSGVAHVAAAVGTPVVVVFGSTNVHLWHPWTSGRWEAVHAQAQRPSPTALPWGTHLRQPPPNVGIHQVLAAIRRVLEVGGPVA